MLNTNSFPSSSFLVTNQRGSVSSYNIHGNHNTETNQLLKTRLITEGNFSLGIESMAQSKITFGNKKYCPS
jgi:hypothetical protein